MDETVQRVESRLMALPLEALLRYWQRLNWWTSVWPLFGRISVMGLTLPEVMVLRILARRSPNVLEVAQCISLSQSAASRTVDRLVGDGLISRKEDPQDRRNKRLALTSAGFGRIEEIEQAFGGEFADLIAMLSPAEQEQIRRLFARLLALFVAHHEGEAERTEWARELAGTSLGGSKPVASRRRRKNRT